MLGMGVLLDEGELVGELLEKRIFGIKEDLVQCPPLNGGLGELFHEYEPMVEFRTVLLVGEA